MRSRRSFRLLQRIVLVLATLAEERGGSKLALAVCKGATIAGQLTKACLEIPAEGSLGQIWCRIDSSMSIDTILSLLAMATAAFQIKFAHLCLLKLLAK
jgi:hypothetical protein